MARYRRYRRTIVRAPKKKWGSNFQGITMTMTNGTQQPAVVHYSNILAQNKTESNAPTPVILKTGNFKLQADFTVQAENDDIVVHLFMYIIFVPEGLAPASSLEAANLIRNHPEWVMAWKMVDGSPVDRTLTAGFQKISISSRLKRNLNSGDSVYAIAICNELAPGATVKVQGQCQFWTCAN